MENKSFKRVLIKRGIIAAIALAAFAGITYLVTTNRISQFDDAVRFFIYDMRNPVLSAVLIPITYLGNWQTLTGASVFLILIRKTRFRFGFSFGAAALSSEFVNKAVKNTVKRARPDKLLHLINQGGHSFPSGHSMTGLVFYGMMLYTLRKEYLHLDNAHNDVQKYKDRYAEDLLNDNLLKTRKRRINFITVAIVLLIILIGVSRIYVGVHYPSDVLGGWCLGIAVLMIAITIRDMIERAWSKKAAKN